MSNRTKTVPGFANPKCYARALKGCSVQMSGENAISKAILKRINQEYTESPGVEIKNMAFQPKDTPQSFGVGSLESKILYMHHNNSLSHLDSEALAAFDAFEIMFYAAAGSRPAPKRVYNVDGDVFERWMLKVVCGTLYGGTMRAERFEVKDVEPPLDWLQTLYGQPFPGGLGLYCQAPSGNELFTVDCAIVNLTPLEFDSPTRKDMRCARASHMPLRSIRCDGSLPEGMSDLAVI